MLPTHLLQRFDRGFRSEVLAASSPSALRVVARHYRNVDDSRCVTTAESPFMGSITTDMLSQHFAIVGFAELPRLRQNAPALTSVDLRRHHEHRLQSDRSSPPPTFLHATRSFLTDGVTLENDRTGVVKTKFERRKSGIVRNGAPQIASITSGLAPVASIKPTTPGRPRPSTQRLDSIRIQPNTIHVYSIHRVR